jgi:lipopolysaccharide transport system permease protein
MPYATMGGANMSPAPSALRPQGVPSRIEGSPPTPVIIIKPKRGWQLIDFKELSEYKGLFYFLILRDLKIRYKQTILGAGWAIIQPFFTMIVFSLFFGKLAKMPSDNIPYPVFSYSALVIWTYFSNSLSTSANSLVGNTELISKVYFPRIIVPNTPIFAGLVDFIISLIILFIMMFFYGMAPTPYVIFFPFLTILTMMIASGMGMWLAALNAQYRDIKYTVPFMIQLWMFVSPVVYPASMVPEKFRLWYALNPMAGVVEGFRSILLGTIPFPFKMVTISTVIATLLLITGAMYFRRMERTFADVI